MPSFTSADGLTLHYTDEGKGLPVIALAGLTRNGADFDHVAPHLPVRLIRPDYRGRGQSDWADPATYTIPQEAADVLALMDHLGLEKAAILGTSRGGLIAMMLAATAKDRLLGVALNDIGPEIAAKGLDVIKDYIGRNPAQKTYAEAAEARAKLWTHFTGCADGALAGRSASALPANPRRPPDPLRPKTARRGSGQRRATHPRSVAAVRRAGRSTTGPDPRRKL